MMEKTFIEKHAANCHEMRAFCKAQGATGEWEREPDRVEWYRHGFVCLALRNEHLGHWCGYVGVPESHPDFKCQDYEELDLDVHGGITYCDMEEEETRLTTERHGKWRWFGFDCAHFGDQMPFYGNILKQVGFNNKESSFFESSGSYKTLAFVRYEVGSLATQLWLRRHWYVRTGQWLKRKTGKLKWYARQRWYQVKKKLLRG